MEVTTKRFQILIDGEPVFLQGMNLFLDPFVLERNPRKIYTPRICNPDVVRRIIPHLIDCGLNCVRIWPTIYEGEHVSSIPDELLPEFAEANLQIILNLPVNWNQKPNLHEISTFLHRYSPQKYPNILLYCIANEVYHGFLMPHGYLDQLHILTRKVTGRPTLVTNANLNFPKYYGADVIGADFFTYRYSISRQGASDVGAVAQMFLEDASQTYKLFPKFILNHYSIVRQYLTRQAHRRNYDPKYFQKNILNVLKSARKHNRPCIIPEYGYIDEPLKMDEIFAHMPLTQMAGHIWYNWSNFDPNIDGIIENIPLFEKFKEICKKLDVIKKKQAII